MLSRDLAQNRHTECITLKNPGRLQLKPNVRFSIKATLQKESLCLLTLVIRGRKGTILAVREFDELIPYEALPVSTVTSADLLEDAHSACEIVHNLERILATSITRESTLSMSALQAGKLEDEIKFTLKLGRLTFETSYEAWELRNVVHLGEFGLCDCGLFQ